MIKSIEMLKDVRTLRESNTFRRIEADSLTSASQRPFKSHNTVGFMVVNVESGQQFLRILR